MKFRARMVDLMAIKKFYSILCTAAKLSKLCVMRLSTDSVYFILAEMGSGTTAANCGNLRCGGPVVWIEMEQSHFFSEYNMEGVTRDDPDIYIELEPDRLAKTLGALRSSNTVRGLKIKLTRKHETPHLSFDIELASAAATLAAAPANSASATPMRNGNLATHQCTHDVPVSLIPRRLWRDFREPEMPPFDVSVYLPNDLKQLKHIAERYRNLGNYFVIHANRSGHFKMALETDEVNVVTHFKNLEIPRFDDTLPQLKRQRGGDRSGSALDLDQDEFMSCRVDLKRFHLFVVSAADQIAPRKVVVNLVAGKMIHVFLVHDDVHIQYFIPAMHD